jgi:flagellar biosynthesis GTPase FlhF
MTNFTKTTVAEAVHALSFEQRNAAYTQGSSYSRNRLEFDGIVKAAAVTLGDNPSFEQWVEYSDEFKAGYIHDNPDNTGNAADAAWTRFAKQLDEKYGLTKPKSTSAAAEKKAAERAAKTEQLLEKHKDATAHDLRSQLEKVYMAMAKNPTNKELRKTQKELDAVLKAKTSEENKAHGEQLKALRSQVREAAGKCTDIEQLEAALDCLSGGFDINYDLGE